MVKRERGDRNTMLIFVTKGKERVGVEGVNRLGK